MPLENGPPTGTFTASVVVSVPVDHRYHALESNRTETKTVTIFEMACTMNEAKQLAEMIRSKNSGAFAPTAIKTAWTGQQEL